MVEIRHTAAADLPALSRLFEQRFDHPLTPEGWHWKYRALPGESRSLVAVAADGEVLAHAGAIALPARWAGGDGPHWQLVDFVGTAARGGLRPPMVELGRALLADLPRPGDVPWIFGFPSERHFRLGQRVFGYHPVERQKIRAGSLGEANLQETGAVVSGDSSRIWGDRAADVERIWSRCFATGVRRTAAFLDWRYHARPERYYRFYRLTSASGEEGFAVFAFVGEEAWGAELCLPDPTAGDSWEVPLRAVAADLLRSGIRRWRFWDDGKQSTHHLFTQQSFFPAPEEGPFLGCRADARGTNPADLARGFHYAMGDYDLT